MELLNNRYKSVSDNLQYYQSYVVTLQEQLDVAIKQKLAIEKELENTLHRLRLVSVLHEVKHKLLLINLYILIKLLYKLPYTQYVHFHNSGVSTVFLFLLNNFNN